MEVVPQAGSRREWLLLGVPVLVDLTGILPLHFICWDKTMAMTYFLHLKGFLYHIQKAMAQSPGLTMDMGGFLPPSLSHFGDLLIWIPDGPGGGPFVGANLKKYGMGFSRNLLSKCSY